MSLDLLAELDTSLTEALASSTNGEKLSGLSTEVLLERHTTLKGERLEMGEDAPGKVKGGLTNRIKSIEKVLTERGVEFEPLPRIESLVTLSGLSNEELLEEFKRVRKAREDAESSAFRAAATRRIKAIRVEVDARKERRAQEEVSSDETPEAQKPSRSRRSKAKAKATA